MGVIILCTSNQGTTKFTVNAIQQEFRCPCIVVVHDKFQDDEVDELKQYCPVFFGGNSITSMINMGMRKLNSEWKMIVMSGSFPKYSTLKKYKLFIKSDKDILYSVLKRKYKFDEASLNGVFMHEKAIKEIGNFSNQDLSLSKLIWASNALDKGYKFKAIIGGRF